MSCLCPVSIPDKVLSDFGYKGREILVPCGHCIGCARDKINDWFVRLYTVYQDHVSKNLPVWFVTVTVDQKLWPGMTKSSPGVKDKVTPWIRSWNERLRYLNDGVMPLRFLCSEFGSEGEKYYDKNGVLRITTGALHFHGFLFGYLPLKRISKGLAETHGHVDFDRVRSAACIRYAVKYATKDYSVSDPLLRSRTFCSPGLGDPSFYFGSSAPTSHVMINGFHYRCPRYLVEKQWINIYGRKNFFDADGRSRLVIDNAISRIERLLSMNDLMDLYVSSDSLTRSWYKSQFEKLQYDPYDYSKLEKLLSLNRIGPGHPALRFRQKIRDEFSSRDLLLSDHSFVEHIPFQTFINQFNSFNYEGDQAFISLSFDFET